MAITMKSPVWPHSIDEAKAVQLAMKDRVKIIPLRRKPRFIAGVDAAFTEKNVIGSVCLYEYPELIPVEDEFSVTDLTFPYIPGYLSFREGPAIIEALACLRIKPHLILVDGQGMAHPKNLGIASHIGVILNIPTIGCAKSRLIGEYEEPEFKRGEWSPLNYEGRVVGAVLRTKDNVRPIFVSPGHRIDLKASIEIVLGCTGRYRIPEPLRRADSLSKKTKVLLR